MYTGILHTHTLVVSLYLVLLLIKTILLLAGKTEKLEKFRAKTKIAEMILATLFLLTGIYLALQSAAITGAWFIVKIALILVILVLGVVAFKKQSKLLAVLAILAYLYVFGISETKDLRFNPDMQSLYGSKPVNQQQWNPEGEGYDLRSHGKFVYQSYCTGCHGPSGQLQKSGAKNLQESTLSLEEMQKVIKNGKKTMPPYKGTLSNQEIKAVAKYVHELGGE